MTLDLEAIKAYCEAATPGPWYADFCVITLQDDKWRPLVETNFYGNRYDGCANAEFVACARTDVPALVTEVEQLREDQARKRKRLTEQGIFINRFEAALDSTQRRLSAAYAKVNQLREELKQVAER